MVCKTGAMKELCRSIWHNFSR